MARDEWNLSSVTNQKCITTRHLGTHTNRYCQFTLDCGCGHHLRMTALRARLITGRYLPLKCFVTNRRKWEVFWPLYAHSCWVVSYSQTFNSEAIRTDAHQLALLAISLSVTTQPHLELSSTFCSVALKDLWLLQGDFSVSFCKGWTYHRKQDFIYTFNVRVESSM